MSASAPRPTFLIFENATASAQASHIYALKNVKSTEVSLLARPTSRLADIMDNDKLMFSIRLFELSFPIVAK